MGTNRMRTTAGIDQQGLRRPFREIQNAQSAVTESDLAVRTYVADPHTSAVGAAVREYIVSTR